MSTRNSTSSKPTDGHSRTEVFGALMEDHKRIKKAYRDFQKLDGDEDAERCEGIVRQVIAELEAHTALEEELLYPAAHAALSKTDLLDEAEVEHESVRALMKQLKGMSADDDKFRARFTVLCEYVLHHVKEEEGELFPQMQRAPIDWETLAPEMSLRRTQLAPPEPRRVRAVRGRPEQGASSRRI